MRICIVGAGAVGVHLGARLALAGTPVAILARGQNLAAIRQRGLTLAMGDRRRSAPVRTCDDPAELGEHDVVVVAVKAPALPSVVGLLPALAGPRTTFVFAMNGIPWWLPERLLGAAPPEVGRLLDPDGLLESTVGSRRAAACVVYSGSELEAPGVVRNTTERNRLILGAPEGADDGRLGRLAELFGRAGFTASVATDIAAEIWSKLLTIVSVSPIAALTGRTNRGICADPVLRPIAAQMIGEAVALGARLGLALEVDVEQRLDQTGQSHHKPSLLQDLEGGRPLELSSTILAVQALARHVGVGTPTIDTIAGLLVGLARTRHLA